MKLHLSYKITANNLNQTATEYPEEYYLSSNYPNPFNPTTTIKYGIKNKTNAIIRIYDVLGRQVRELINKVQEPGNYNVLWDGKNDFGLRVVSGIYFYKMETKEFTTRKKMLLIK